MSQGANSNYVNPAAYIVPIVFFVFIAVVVSAACRYRYYRRHHHHHHGHTVVVKNNYVPVATPVPYQNTYQNQTAYPGRPPVTNPPPFNPNYTPGYPQQVVPPPYPGVAYQPK
jgi:hypothetical protein